MKPNLEPEMSTVQLDREALARRAQAAIAGGNWEAGAAGYLERVCGVCGRPWVDPQCSCGSLEVHERLIPPTIFERVGGTLRKLATPTPEPLPKATPEQLAALRAFLDATVAYQRALEQVAVSLRDMVRDARPDLAWHQGAVAMARTEGGFDPNRPGDVALGLKALEYIASSAIRQLEETEK